MKFFSLENPVWKFIGNLADFFILSCLWYLCSLPVVTAGAATSAVYYVTLKMSRDKEGELFKSFFKAFKENLKPGCLLGVGYLVAGVLLGLDIVICLQQDSVMAGAMFFTSVVLLACGGLFCHHDIPLDCPVRQHHRCAVQDGDCPDTAQSAAGAVGAGGESCVCCSGYFCVLAGAAGGTGTGGLLQLVYLQPHF